MKVVYIPDVGETYGAAISFKEMVSGLNRIYGVEPVILTSQTGILTEYAKENDFETHAIGHKAFLISSGSTPVRKFIKKSLKPYYKMQYKKAIEAAIHEAEKYVDFSQVDLIHSNVNRNDVGALLAEKYGIPHEWHIREFGDKDYECFSLRDSYIEFMNSHADRFIAVSKAVKEHWAEKGLDRDRIDVAYDGVDPCRYDINTNRKKDDKIRMIFSGAIIPSKGQIQAIQALAGLDPNLKKRIRLDIYGTGAKEYVWKLKKIIKDNGLEGSVEFKGYCDDLYKKINSYDIGFVCSRSEGFGRVTIEYMMSGVCVIASDTGANVELIRDGENGVLYRYSDIQDLRKKLQDVIFHIEQTRKMAENAYKISKASFTTENGLKDIYGVYEKVCSVKQEK